MFATNVYYLLPLSLVNCLFYLFFNHFFLLVTVVFLFLRLQTSPQTIALQLLGLSLDSISLNSKY